MIARQSSYKIRLRRNLKRCDEETDVDSLQRSRSPSKVDNRPTDF